MFKIIHNRHQHHYFTLLLLQTILLWQYNQLAKALNCAELHQHLVETPPRCIKKLHVEAFECCTL